MKTICSLPAIALLGLLFVAPVLAQERTYLGASVGTRFENGQASGLAQPEVEHETFKAFLGVRLTDKLAAEFGYHDLGTTRCCPRLEGFRSEQELEGFSGVLMLSQPVGRFELFAKGGVMWWEISAEQQSLGDPGFEDRFTADGRSLMGGIGASTHLAERWRLRLEYELFDSSVDTLTLGLTFDL